MACRIVTVFGWGKASIQTAMSRNGLTNSRVTALISSSCGSHRGIHNNADNGLALVGGVWLMWLLNYNLSVAVAVGFIALAAETGVVMLIYLDHAWEAVKTSCRTAGSAPGVADLYAAMMEGAVERVRPKMMTVVAIMAGLLPILWGTGTGSEVMSRMSKRERSI